MTDLLDRAARVVEDSPPSAVHADLLRLVASVPRSELELLAVLYIVERFTRTKVPTSSIAT